MIGLGLFKAMRVTLRNALKTPFTIQYPDRKVGIVGAAKNEGKSPAGLVATKPITAAKAALSMYSVPVDIPQNRRFRGNEFTWYEDRCTGCASCAKYCPLGIIEIVTSPVVSMCKRARATLSTFSTSILVGACSADFASRRVLTTRCTWVANSNAAHTNVTR